jgi:diguanylate cyclase (GGDEF)-like protein/PAS domain S-box-containing protein
MEFYSRIIMILLIISNIALWLFHTFIDQTNATLVAAIILSITNLPLLWWFGRSYDKYKVQTKELKASNYRFQTMFENAAIGITLIDQTGKIIMVNPKIEEMLGYPEKELKNMTFKDISYDEDDAKKNYDLLQQLVNREIDSYQFEKRYKCKDGKSIWGQVTSSLFPNKDGELSYVVGMVLDITERKETEQKLIEMNHKLEGLSKLDGLTGLANRRHFNKYLEQEWEKALINADPLTLILFDIDFFKNYNDTYGHLVGDICLKNIARILTDLIMHQDGLAARFGGEEFAVVMPNSEEKKANLLAEQIRFLVEDMQFPHANSTVSPYVTVSVGVSLITPNTETTTNDLIETADIALYQAKMDGRNQVCSFSSK